MGCVTSKRDINDLHPNIFQVCNIDEQGNRLSSGQLEINETEIVFYQKGKPPIRWPLKTLRRYGHDDQMFSFESGRRCPTGSGIYAFSCQRAAKLFNFVQSHIQIRNDDTLLGEGTTAAVTRSSDYLEPRPPRLSVTNGPSSRLSSVGSSNASPSPPPNNDFPPSYSNYYANEPIFRVDEGAELPLSPTASGENDEGIMSPVYMNVGTGSEGLEEAEEDKHCYMNLVAGGAPPLVSQRLPTLLPPSPPERAVNYIVLDLDPTSPPAPPSPTTRQSTESYATIDFNKTVALSHSVNPNCIDNEGSRKTRHNSATPRQSASLSD